MKVIGGPNGTEKSQTTLKCLRTLESLQPDPPFYPAEAGEPEQTSPQFESLKPYPGTTPYFGKWLAYFAGDKKSKNGQIK